MKTTLLACLGTLMLLSACNKDGGDTVLVEGQCADNTYCEGMQACIDKTCQDVTCLVNTDCGLGQTCSEEAGYACVDGCSEDSDCLANQTCNEGSCEQAACVDVDVDCAIGEQCEGGECVAMEHFCEACDEANPCAEGYQCKWFEKEKVSACLPECTPDPDGDDECPSRTICYGEGGNTTGVCSAGCPDLWAIGAY